MEGELAFLKGGGETAWKLEGWKMEGWKGGGVEGGKGGGVEGWKANSRSSRVMEKPRGRVEVGKVEGGKGGIERLCNMKEILDIRFEM